MKKLTALRVRSTDSKRAMIVATREAMRMFANRKISEPVVPDRVFYEGKCVYRVTFTSGK